MKVSNQANPTGAWRRGFRREMIVKLLASAADRPESAVLKKPEEKASLKGNRFLCSLVRTSLVKRLQQSNYLRKP